MKDYTGTEEFSIINHFLGWGDPHNGIWFIGVEEGGSYLCADAEQLNKSREKIQLLSHKLYDCYETESERGDVVWPVATVSAKIAAQLSARQLPWSDYRQQCLWYQGNGVFNGNLLSLGKPHLEIEHWPAGYQQLFGFSAKDYQQYYELAFEHRRKAFHELREMAKPQAIVCFGMSHWTEFAQCFVGDSKSVINNDLFKTKCFLEEKVILTRHFSNGMPDRTVDYIANMLKEWRVRIR